MVLINPAIPGGPVQPPAVLESNPEKYRARLFPLERLNNPSSKWYNKYRKTRNRATLWVDALLGSFMTPSTKLCVWFELGLGSSRWMYGYSYRVLQGTGYCTDTDTPRMYRPVCVSGHENVKSSGIQLVSGRYAWQLPIICLLPVYSPRHLRPVCGGIVKFNERCIQCDGGIRLKDTRDGGVVPSAEAGFHSTPALMERTLGPSPRKRTSSFYH